MEYDTLTSADVKALKTMLTEFVDTRFDVAELITFPVEAITADIISAVAHEVTNVVEQVRESHGIRHAIDWDEVSDKDIADEYIRRI